MKKADVVNQEKAKLFEIFTAIDEKQKKLAEGLIDEAAFLFGENYELREVLEKTGTIRINPDNIFQQKQTPAAAQYLKNLNAYTVVIKALNSILSKNSTDDDDEDLSEFE